MNVRIAAFALAGTIAMFARSCWVDVAHASPALPEPGFPYLTFSLTAAGMATAGVSVTMYQPSGSGVGPLREWALQVQTTGSGFLQWTVDVELSNDGALWTSILQHKQGALANGAMTWGPHKTARQARLKCTALTVGAVATASGYAEP